MMVPYFFSEKGTGLIFNSLKQIMRILIKTCKWETDVLHRKQHVTTRSSYKTIDFYKMFSELKSTGKKTT